MRKELFCHVCDDYKIVDVVKRNEVYTLKGEDIKIEAEVCICKSFGEELFDMELDEANIERALEQYRKKHGLLTSNKIKAIRN